MPSSLAHSLQRAAQAVAAVASGRNLNDALDERWRVEPGLPAASRGAIQDLAYGTLRDFGRADFFLARLLRRPPDDAQVLALLRVALHRLERRPQDAHTTVNQAVEATRAFANGAFKGLVNGVLRSFLRRRDELLAAAGHDEQAHWRHPGWWIARLRTAYPDQWQSILEAGNSHPPMTLRVNARRTRPDEYLARLAAAGIEAQSLEGGALLLARPVPVDRLPDFGAGAVSVQDAGAQLVAPLLDLAPGLRVLDACAAPGGKTCHMLEQTDLRLLALDADARRLGRLEQNLCRLRLHAEVRAADCRHVDAWWDGKPFDRILADVPCSASGVVRRHPDIKWLRREADLAGFARQQGEILDALWRVLAPGGKLLYATCSLFPEENSQTVAAFAERRRGECRRLPVQGRPELQLLPTASHDGFFYALLEKHA